MTFGAFIGWIHQFITGTDVSFQSQSCATCLIETCNTVVFATSRRPQERASAVNFSIVLNNARMSTCLFTSILQIRISIVLLTSKCAAAAESVSPISNVAASANRPTFVASHVSEVHGKHISNTASLRSIATSFSIGCIGTMKDVRT